MRLALHEFSCGPCPYLGERAWRIEEFSSPDFAPGLYEELLRQGFRRSGMAFYRNRCPGCGLCIPLRLDARSFRPSRSQRHLERLNADLTVTLSPAEATEERFDLYRRYKAARHASPTEAPPEEDDPSRARSAYAAFLIESPFATTMVTDYRDSHGRLVASGYLDVLPEGLSSVYFAFDPSESRRSLGTWSVLRELRLGAELGKPWYYLGFWVPGSPKMDYKARFSPFEYARDDAWHPVSGQAEARASLGLP